MWSTAFRVSFCLRRPNFLCRPVLLPLFHPPAERLCVKRGYSSQGPPEIEKVVVGVPKPLIRLRAEIFFFLIRNFLDQDFNFKEFSEGARQAISFVSRLLSQRKFDALENLVAKEILTDLKEKCSVLSDNYRNALVVEADEIKGLSPWNVNIQYDNGRRFVNILMHFWYVKDMDLLAEDTSALPLYQVIYGNHNITETQRVLLATYEFTREFTQGVKPDWIITYIQHSKVLE